jgi:hypothetical protein
MSDPALNFLFSYHYLQKTKLAEGVDKAGDPVPQLFLDSGAFSAFTQGAEIPIEQYAEFVNAHRERFCVVSNLDAIGDHEQTMKNQEELEKLGVEAMPVFHTGEPWAVLDHYVANYEYIALGGMVPYIRDHSTSGLMPWIVGCFKRAKSHTRFHGFGVTAWPIISQFPWKSVDSTTWRRSSRFGMVDVFIPSKGKWGRCNVGRRDTCERLRKEIRDTSGLSWTVFADRDKFNNEIAIKMGVANYRAAEAFLQNKHGEFRLYMADSSLQTLQIANEAFRCLIE